MIAFLVLSECALVEVGEKEFANYKKSGNSFMVLFYAPWCGHCKQFKPEYTRAAEKLKGIVDLVAVNCDDNANKQLCGQYEVTGFPTVKFINHNGARKAALTYQQARTEQAVVNYALANHKKPFSQAPTSDELKKQIADQQEYGFVLTPSAKTSSAIYKICRSQPKLKFFVETEFKEDDVQNLADTAFGSQIKADTVNIGVCKNKVSCKVYQSKDIDEVVSWLSANV